MTKAFAALCCPEVGGERASALWTLKAFHVLKPMAGLMPRPLSKAEQRWTASRMQASVTMLAAGRMAVWDRDRCSLACPRARR